MVATVLSPAFVLKVPPLLVHVYVAPKTEGEAVNVDVPPTPQNEGGTIVKLEEAPSMVNVISLEEAV